MSKPAVKVVCVPAGPMPSDALAALIAIVLKRRGK